MLGNILEALLISMGQTIRKENKTYWIKPKKTIILYLRLE
jgi:hypothetical protein